MQILTFDPQTGKPKCMEDLDNLLLVTPLPFAVLWRDPAVSQFTGEVNPQTLLAPNATSPGTGNENEQVGFHKFQLATDRLSVKTLVAGTYGYVFRAQMTKNDAGDDSGTTSAQVYVNNVGKIGLTTNWFSFVDGTAPGDDSNTPNDKAKSGLLRLYKDDIVGLNITDTLGNDVYGVQLSLEYRGPVDMDISGNATA